MDTGQSPEAVGVEDREPQPVLSIRANVRVAQLTQAQGESLQALWSFMERRGVTPAGPPYVRYHTFGQTEADLEIGAAVDAAPDTADDAEPGLDPSADEETVAAPHGSSAPDAADR